MYNSYKIFIGVKKDTKKIFEKILISEGYQIIKIDEDEILFAKKSIESETKEYLKAEQFATKILISIVKKYKEKGLIYLDFSEDMEKIIENLKENHYHFKIDNRITWRIRQAITRAIIEKNGEVYGRNNSTN